MLSFPQHPGGLTQSRCDLEHRRLEDTRLLQTPLRKHITSSVATHKKRHFRSGSPGQSTRGAHYSTSCGQAWPRDVASLCQRGPSFPCLLALAGCSSRLQSIIVSGGEERKREIKRKRERESPERGRKRKNEGGREEGWKGGREGEERERVREKRDR